MILSCVVALLLRYDAELRLRRIFAPWTIAHRAQRITREASARVLALARVYCNFRVDMDYGSKPLPKQFLLVCNHQSLMDIPMIFHYFFRHSIRFVSKKELGRFIPMISQILRYQGHCLIDRKSNLQQSMKSLEQLARRSTIEEISPMIFPEGTRSRSGAVMRFHSAGVRRILEFSKLPIVSVAMDGGRRIATVKGLITNIWNGGYRIKILDVYEPVADKAEIPALLDKIHDEIKAQVFEWNGIS